MVALDMDGTLLDYSPEGQEPRVNWAVIAMLKARAACSAAIYTNQGGLLFGVRGLQRRDGKPYPQPQQFIVRLSCAVADVRVSCWHQAAEQDDIMAAALQAAASRVRQGLPGLGLPAWTVYTTPKARKPRGDVLRWMGATEYYGDSDEDEHAAAAAGIPFVRVVRFY
jgi:hypothetical protein